MAKSKLRQLVRLPWAADGCPWVGKLRTVLPLNDRVIRDSAVQLGLTHQRGASGVDSPGRTPTDAGCELQGVMQHQQHSQQHQLQTPPMRGVGNLPVIRFH